MSTPTAALPVILALCVAVCSFPAHAQSSVDPKPVRVLVLGMYHFSNPGQDLYNPQVDDVLAPHRQAEVAALVDALATFRPTAVATEREAAPPYDDPAWPFFVQEADSALAAVTDESIQVGFRLAHQVGIERVYAIDERRDEGDGEPSYFPYGALQEFAHVTDQEAALEAASDASDRVAAFQAAQPTSTIPELLLEKSEHDDRFYWDVLAFGAGEDQPGPELAAAWFLRNAKIFNKLVQVTAPGDRVVVLFGAAHGAWIREMVERTSGYELEPAEPYLRAAAALAARRGQEQGEQ